MNRSKKRKNRLFPMLITVMVMTAVLTPAAYADTDGTEPKITQQPDQLVLRLGTRWTGWSLRCVPIPASFLFRLW